LICLTRLVICRTTALVLACLPGIAGAAAQPALPPGFVYLRDVDPSIAQDMRYAGSNNFVGRTLPGYDAAECVLRADVARALKHVQDDLQKSGYSLKTYDCYRPTRAVRAMALWANDGRNGDQTKRFFPQLAKRTLFASGYIAAYSAHSGGNAVDLTVVRADHAARLPPFDPRARYGACTAAERQRAPDNSLDMGTGFDCFDGRSHTRSQAITREQRRNRDLLLAAMRRHGFKNYFREWWHFTFGANGPHYDIPIRPRRR
jgi:D-alanyl-D-alanine dipeptidase